MRRPAPAIAVAFLLAFTPAGAETGTEACFRLKINEARAAAGRPALTRNATIEKIARAHSMEMAAQQTIFHNEDLAEQAPNFRAIGENVGMGASCPALHQAFMDSPGHRANILDPDYTQIGVGTTIRDDRIYVVEVFFDPKPAAKPKPKQPSPKPPKPDPPECS